MDTNFPESFIARHTDCYFSKSRQAAAIVGHNPLVEWQVFQKNNAVLAGMQFMPEIFAHIHARIEMERDGQHIQPGKPVMRIRGYFQDIVETETIYLGILSRCTRVATNVAAAVKVANGKPVLFFPGRFDIPEAQRYDGYAAKVGGAAGAATNRQAAGGFWDRPVGTMPHALIAAFGGDTATACLAFHNARPTEEVWALVDFHNDCAFTALCCAEACRKNGFELTGVRLDTSEKLIDKGLQYIPTTDETSRSRVRGVNPILVRHVRTKLNAAGFDKVQIAVSGGFTPEKIALFERVKSPVDVYAVGEGFLRGSNPFTSDIVRYYDPEGGEWMNGGKVGRGYIEHPLPVVIDTLSVAASLP